MRDPLFPDTPAMWDRLGKTPNANTSEADGHEYFRIHEFWFDEGSSGYSQLDSASGFDPSFRESAFERWLVLLAAWEEESVTQFADWERRSDMMVVSRARVQARESGSYDDTYRRDIIRSWSGKSGMTGFYDQTFKPNPDAWLPQTRAGFSNFVSVENLQSPGIRIQCAALTKPISARMTHHTSVNFVDDVDTPGARLVVWVESELNREELAWRWFGAVYSWRHCRMESVGSCSSATVNAINTMTMPLVRTWAQLVRQAGQGSLKMPPDRTPKRTPIPEKYSDEDIFGGPRGKRAEDDDGGIDL